MNTKKLFLSLTFAMFCTFTFAQTPAKPEKPAKPAKPVMVGGDRDKHGCIGSAGYTYSVIKKDCVRLFEQKTQLKEVNAKGSATFNATVIFSADNKQAEIFVPRAKSSTILTRTRGTKRSSVWKKGKYALYQKGDHYILKESNKPIYAQIS
ncbi:hypothetical protein [Pedobacter nutrimenti]|uniref:hypothetical protein n=1 Tax=Pedobacter nutrimenti TaxID=1241337 RepID=UPI002931F5A2|nr:hypothetical protein [Pedobacter nutrimenti]